MREILYDQVKAAQYIARLLRGKYFSAEDSVNFFEYLHFMGGNLNHLLHNVIEDIKAERDIPEKKEALKLLHTAKGNLRSIMRDLYEILIECSYVESFIRVQELKKSEEISKYQISDAKNYELVRKKFEKIFGLSHDALDFGEFAYIYKANNYIDHYLGNNLDVWKARNKKILACVLNMNISRLDNAINELETCQILEVFTGMQGRGEGVHIDDTTIKIFKQPEIDPKDLFCVQMKGETLPLENFSINKEELNYIIKLLKLKNSMPVHIMLYGPPGTGKTTFTRSLSKALGLKAFTVNIRDYEVSASATSVIACLNIASKHYGFAFMGSQFC